jgi:polyhydroxyalkanoate synthesis repressor PhaR
LPKGSIEKERIMFKQTSLTIIKKYANRRLYNTSTSTYITLDNVAEMIGEGEDFIVEDAQTMVDITHSVLLQIIVELENKQQRPMFPVDFLYQIISCYGHPVQLVIPNFLEQSLKEILQEKQCTQTL